MSANNKRSFAMNAEVETIEVAGLESLVEAMQALDNEEWIASGLPTNSFGGPDWTSLPTFGGESPRNTSCVWSWDADRLIVGTSGDDLQIIPRAEHDPREVFRVDPLCADGSLVAVVDGVTVRIRLDGGEGAGVLWSVWIDGSWIRSESTKSAAIGFAVEALGLD
jgi:hypothetical protein